MFGYNPCDNDPFLAEKRNMEREAFNAARFEAVCAALREWGYDPEDLDDPLATYEDELADAAALEDELERLA